jgi:hypothetical protein
MQKFWLTSTILFGTVAAVAPASAESASGTSAVPAAAAAEASASCPAGGSSGSGFRVTNGAIVGPNGPYVVRGINIYAYSMAAANNGASIKATFKGLNFLRYITRPLNAPGTYDPVVNYLTSLGVVVEFEDHPDGGGAQGLVYTAPGWLPRAPGMPPWPLTSRLILMSGSEPTMSRRPREDRYRHGSARRTTPCGAQAITTRSCLKYQAADPGICKRRWTHLTTPL